MDGLQRTILVSPPSHRDVAADELGRLLLRGAVGGDCPAVRIARI